MQITVHYHHASQPPERRLAGTPCAKISWEEHAIWSCMVLYGHPWSRRVLHGHPRSCIVKYGPVWPFMVLYCPDLACTVLFGSAMSFVARMVKYGSAWSHMIAYDHVWSHMVQYETVQKKNGLFGWVYRKETYYRCMSSSIEDEQKVPISTTLSLLYTCQEQGSILFHQFLFPSTIILA